MCFFSSVESTGDAQRYSEAPHSFTVIPEWLGRKRWPFLTPHKVCSGDLLPVINGRHGCQRFCCQGSMMHCDTPLDDIIKTRPEWTVHFMHITHFPVSWTVMETSEGKCAGSPNKEEGRTRKICKAVMDKLACFRTLGIGSTNILFPCFQFYN